MSLPLQSLARRVVRRNSATGGRVAELLEDGLPFLFPEVVQESDFLYLVNRFFATDRATIPKGMIEVQR